MTCDYDVMKDCGDGDDKNLFFIIGLGVSLNLYSCYSECS